MKQHKVRRYRQTILYLYSSMSASGYKSRSWKHNRFLNYSWKTDSISSIGWRASMWFTNHGKIKI